LYSILDQLEGFLPYFGFWAISETILIIQTDPYTTELEFK